VSTKNKKTQTMLKALHGNPFCDLAIAATPVLGDNNEKGAKNRQSGKDVRHIEFAVPRMMAVNMGIVLVSGVNFKDAKKMLARALAAMVEAGAYSGPQAERVGTAVRKMVSGNGKPSASLIVKNEDGTIDEAASHAKMLKAAKTIDAVNKHFAKPPTQAEERAAALTGMDKAIRRYLSTIDVDDRTEAIVVAHATETVQKFFVELGKNSKGNPARPVTEIATPSPAALAKILASEETATAATA